MTNRFDGNSIRKWPNVSELISFTLGDKSVRVALLDGGIDSKHPALAGRTIETLDLGQVTPTAHGTRIASLLVGRPDGPAPGLAPGITLLTLSPYHGREGAQTLATDQVALAYAILTAIEAGAHIINFSGGQLDSSGEASPILEQAIETATKSGVLILASAGNDGCACLHVPAAHRNVLAVGACNENGNPAEFSNWGDKYRGNGILAPGVNLITADLDGGVISVSGTSYATAVASGVAALLLSAQLKTNPPLSPLQIRDILIQTAKPCIISEKGDCARRLNGVIDPGAALAAVLRNSKPQLFSMVKGDIMTPDLQPVGNTQTDESTFHAAISDSVRQVHPSEGCGCGDGGSPQPQLVYALGQLDWDFGSEARRDALAQAMQPASVYDPTAVLDFLEARPEFESSLTWVLKNEGFPIYALQPHGAYALKMIEELRRAFKIQLDPDDAGERVSVAGIIVGQVRLFNGQSVPLVVPDLRGFYQWDTRALIAVLTRSDKAVTEGHIRSFLDRVYHQFANMGIASQDRAMNYAATNAFQVSQVMSSAASNQLILDTIDVQRSAIARPGSDCWDIVMTFFDPKQRQQVARSAYRFTVDVSEVIPVTVGRVRSWSVY